jgi:hypothetical protein
VKAKLDFVGIPDDEDWGTADSLLHIKDKIKVSAIYCTRELEATSSIGLLTKNLSILMQYTMGDFKVSKI